MGKKRCLHSRTQKGFQPPHKKKLRPFSIVWRSLRSQKAAQTGGGGMLVEIHSELWKFTGN